MAIKQVGPDHAGADVIHDATLPVPELDQALDDAERLLGYAAESGIDVAPEIAQRIISAKRQRSLLSSFQATGNSGKAVAKEAR